MQTFFAVDSDPLEQTSRRITLWIFPLGVVATLISLWLLSLSRQISPVEQLMQGLVVGLLLGLEVALWRRWLSLRQVWTIALLCIAVYILVHVALQTALVKGISPILLWFPAVYLVVFTLFESRQALRFSLVYYALGLLMLMLGLSQTERKPELLNSAAQFGMANLMSILVVYAFSQVRERYHQMRQMAHSDPLTGLPNRRYIEPLLEQEVFRAERYNRGFAVLIADLDHFKEVNDQHSHAVGDQVLREVALRLTGCLRRSDTLARWGGEEFLVLAPATNLEQARLLGNRMLETMRERPFVGHIPLTLSLGIGCYHPHDTLEQIIFRADAALYRAKNLGRDRLEVEV
jgi:diguanylate cyclase (GGDEF)-like protein